MFYIQGTSWAPRRREGGVGGEMLIPRHILTISDTETICQLDLHLSESQYHHGPQVGCYLNRFSTKPILHAKHSHTMESWNCSAQVLLQIPTWCSMLFLSLQCNVIHISACWNSTWATSLFNITSLSHTYTACDLFSWVLRQACKILLVNGDSHTPTATSQIGLPGVLNLWT